MRPEALHGPAALSRAWLPLSVILGLAALPLVAGCALYPPADKKDSGASDGGAHDMAPHGDGARLETAPTDGPKPETLPPLTLKPSFTINGDPNSTHGYATVKPGIPVQFASVANCPAAYGCTYGWDFGNSKTGSGVKPSATSYSAAGLYRVTLTVKDSQGKLVGTAAGVVTVWTGKHTDTFARTQVEWDKHLWLKPLDGATVAIKSGWLNTKTTKGLPGTTAIAASPQCKDLHLEVTLRRHAVASEDHYANILLRVHPGKRKGSYYRLQIRQGTQGNGSEVSLQIYKVTSDQDELGTSIMAAPAVLAGFDTARKENIRFTIDLSDGAGGVPTFHVSAAAASNPGKKLLQLSGVKDSSAPHSYAGFIGLSLYQGEASFDDFSLSSTASVPTDAGVPDGGALDAGVPGDQGMSPDAGVPDAAMPDIGLPPKVTPKITVSGTATGYATVATGGSLSFAALLACPAPHTCLYKWNFGNGKTASGMKPAAVKYATAGLFHVKLSVTDASGYPMGTATAAVTAWGGTMTDNFNRNQVQWDKYLWHKPLNSKSVFSIKSNQLYTTGSLKLPGSGAILASPLVKNVHMEVTIKRSPLTKLVHYSDVVLRMHPTKLNGSFYRVRIKEGVAVYNNELDLEIFKITNSADEHGVSIVPSPPILSGFDPTRTTDIRVIIDLKDDAKGVPTFDVVFADASNTSKVLLQLKGLKDTKAPVLSYAGMVGLTQYEGETYFDNFSMKQLTP